MRVFIAIDLSPAAREALARVGAKVVREIGRQAPTVRVTWVTPDRMHLTLRFFADASEAEVAALRGVLAVPLGVAAFEVVWGGLGVFPPRGVPRVIWVGMVEGELALRSAASALDARLAVVGIPPDGRSLSPHLTLGRIRDGGRWRMPDLPGTGTIARDTIDHLTLYESRLSPQGPTYTALAEGRLEN